ncbi:helix-turn-helix domain-containing protein [Nocardioides sp. InS609-2]|nr:helix-turn-helix domain-containing protein [Nocardioides sp. InS609-2]
MSGIPAYDRETYVEDITSLRRRGLTWAEVAADLGISLRTLHRIRSEVRA